MGIWVAFSDATVNNGGMWGVPKSHSTKTNVFMKRHIDPKTGVDCTYFDKDLPDYDVKSNSVPLEAKKGTVVLLHGDFVHFSHANTSKDERHAYTLHCVETHNAKWEEDNWIQRKDNQFRKVNNHKV